MKSTENSAECVSSVTGIPDHGFQKPADIVTVILNIHGGECFTQFYTILTIKLVWKPEIIDALIRECIIYSQMRVAIARRLPNF